MFSVSEALAAVAAVYENPLVRFATSGTLISIFGIASLMVRRRNRGLPSAHKSRWAHLVITIAIFAFYALIAPTGGPLFDGIGNLLGIGLAGTAAALRLATAGALAGLASQCMFYVALPVAVGVPWGLVALSLPACAALLAARHNPIVSETKLSSSSGH